VFCTHSSADIQASKWQKQTWVSIVSPYGPDDCHELHLIYQHCRRTSTASCEGSCTWARGERASIINTSHNTEFFVELTCYGCAYCSPDGGRHDRSQFLCFLYSLCGFSGSKFF